MKGLQHALNVFTFIISAFFLSVATAGDATQIISLSTRISVAGVSLLPPQENGWVYMREHPARTEFGKSGSKEGQSFTGMVVLSKLPHFKTEKDFLEIITKQRSRDSGNKRYEEILNEVSISHDKNTLSFRFHKKYKDYGAINLPTTSRYLIVEDVGTILQHPDKKNIAVYIALSQRSKPEDASESFVEIALEFIKNANLVPLEL